MAAASSTVLQELMRLGEALGYEGPDLREFVKEQQEKDREGRREEREFQREREERDRVERDKTMEFEKFKLEMEMKKIEAQGRVEGEVEGLDSSHVSGIDIDANEGPQRVFFNETRLKGPRMSPFDEKDENGMDAYLHRFERYAELQGWPRDGWAIYLAALLKGKALDVYSRLTPEQAKDYEALKTALLKRYELTEEGYKNKFYKSKPESGESPAQFIVRLENYFMRWVTLAKIDQSFEGLRTLLVRERYLATCSKTLEVFLRERAIKGLEELGKIAEQHEDAHKVSTVPMQDRPKQAKFPNRSPRRQWRDQGKSNQGYNQGQNKPRCFVCNKIGHVARNCFKRVQANAMVSHVTESELDSTEVTQAMSSRQSRPSPGQCFQPDVEVRANNSEVPLSFRSSQSGYSRQSSNYVPGPEDPLVPRYACKLHNQVSCPKCLYVPNTGHHSCGAMIQQEVMFPCGCVVPFIDETCNQCHIHGTRMPTAEGKLFDKSINVLRDTGCSTVVVRRDLVPDDFLTGETTVCALIDGTVRRNPLARITVDTPYLKGTITATCMTNTLYDLIVGNVPEAENFMWSCKGQIEEEVNTIEVLPRSVERSEDVTTESFVETQAVTTRSQSHKEKTLRPLKVTQSIDSQLDVGELSQLQRDDDTLKAWFEKAKSQVTEPNQETKFEVKHELLWRIREDQGRQVKQLVVPQTLREKVLRLGHDSILSGHQGVKKTLDRITSEFFWPGVNADIKRYCQSCDICQRTTAKGRVSKVPLGQMPLIDRPFKRVAVDLIGPIAPVTDRGNRYILTMVDYATRYPEATALKSVDTETVAEALFTMFSRVGFPEEVLSDQGSQFVSDVMKGVSRLLSISQLHATVYHPMCNGLVERFNGTLKAMLRRMCEEKPQDWDRYLPALLFAYREVPQESLHFSPFELLYGRSVRGPMSILRELWTKQTTDPEVKSTYQYVIDLQDRLEQTCDLARQELAKAQSKQKKYYDVRSKDRVFQAGDKVLILLPTDENKLLMHWKGPFEILERKNGHDYRVQLNNRVKLFHANMLKKYHVRNKESELEKQQVGAMIVDEQQDLGDSSDQSTVFQSEQKETYRDVNINPELTAEQRQEVEKLVAEFADIFTDVPKVTNLGEHSIQLTSSEPVRTRPYPLPFALREEVNREIQSMLDNHIIEPSTAAYLSPIVVVKKRDGSNRICVDYRKLNKVTLFDSEPMPQVQEIFSDLSGSRYYSKFDFCKGYWQVKMRSTDKDKTTFAGPDGLYRFCVMPFGLVNAPATFSRIMRKLLSGLRNLKNYLDDVLSHTAGWAEHPLTLRKFFLRVRQTNLALKPSKCFIGYTSLVFLGHEIGYSSVSPNEKLVKKIKDAPSPTNKKQLRSFLGLVGYYRSFVPNFATVAAPLFDLTKKGAPEKLQWTGVQEQAFQTLKRHVCAHPVLCLPDMSKPFILQTDASAEGLGAILLQETEGVKHPVAFASKRLLPREKNYSTIEREAFAIIWGVQKFQNYLIGTHFLLETDHHPLQYLDRAKYQNSRIMRWSLLLQPYRFTVCAIKGSQNVGADFLSRYV